jgi:guanylate kinase
MELEPRLKQKIAHYQPDPVKLEQISHAQLLFLVGITGAGKNALLHRLLEKYPNDYRFIVSHTTRAPRENQGVMERDGVEYHFIGLPAMERMIDNHEFVEAQVIHDSWVSGTSVAEIRKIQETGAIPVNDVDIQGADKYVEIGLNARPIFVLPPSFEEWMRRFRGRYNNDQEIDEAELVSRLQSAVREIEHALSVEHFFIVINDDLEKAVEVINDIARGEAVEPHYHKAMAIAEHMLDELRAELARLV